MIRGAALAFVLAPLSVWAAPQLTVSWAPYAEPQCIDIVIERASPDPAGPFTPVVELPIDGGPFVDTGVTFSTQYCYRARAYRVRDGMYSVDYSNTACGTAVELAPPPALTVTAPAEGATVPKGRVTITGTSPAGPGVTVRARLDSTALSVWRDGTTGVWRATPMMNVLGPHIVGVAVWAPDGQVTTQTIVFTVVDP